MSAASAWIAVGMASVVVFLLSVVLWLTLGPLIGCLYSVSCFFLGIMFGIALRNEATP